MQIIVNCFWKVFLAFLCVCVCVVVVVLLKRSKMCLKHPVQNWFPKTKWYFQGNNYFSKVSVGLNCHQDPCTLKKCFIRTSLSLQKHVFHRSIVPSGKSQLAKAKRGGLGGRSPSFLQAQASALSLHPPLKCLHRDYHKLVRGLLYPNCSLFVYFSLAGTFHQH